MQAPPVAAHWLAAAERGVDKVFQSSEQGQQSPQFPPDSPAPAIAQSQTGNSSEKAPAAEPLYQSAAAREYPDWQSRTFETSPAKIVDRPGRKSIAASRRAL